MANDTTRMEKLADDLSAVTIPSCKHMEREEYRDCVMQMLEDLEQLGRRDGCIAAAWALDALPSLQRELAEARREITRLRLGMSGAADSMVSLGRSDYAEMIRDWIRSTPPGPSDAKGEHIGEVNKLVPLTDESVRGVLVDALPDEITNGAMIRRDVFRIDCAGGKFVKVRPASEFGVPDLDLTNDLLAKLSDALGIKFDRRVGAWLDPILEAIAKLKSTPAEPAQKLVPLPKGAVVHVPDGPPRFLRYNDVYLDALGVLQRWSKGDESIAKYQALRWIDPAIYGVDAERVRELENRVLAVQLERDALASLVDELKTNPNSKAEAERLRKLLDESFKGCRVDPIEMVRIIQSVDALRKLLGLPANSQINVIDAGASEVERLRKAVEHLAGECDRLADSLQNPETTKRICAVFAQTVADDLRAALTPPTAASGEPAGICATCGKELAAVKGGERYYERCTRCNPASAPAAESQGNAQHHSAGAKIPEGQFW